MEVEDKSSEMESSVFLSFGVGLNRFGNATDASRVSYGKNEALGKPPAN